MQIVIVKKKTSFIFVLGIVLVLFDLMKTTTYILDRILFKDEVILIRMLKS